MKRAVTPSPCCEQWQSEVIIFDATSRANRGEEPEANGHSVTYTERFSRISKVLSTCSLLPQSMAGHTCQTFCRTSPTNCDDSIHDSWPSNCDDSIHCSSPSKDCCSQARSMVVRHLIVQAAEQVLPTAMTRYMVVVLARLGALGHP